MIDTKVIGFALPPFIVPGKVVVVVDRDKRIEVDGYKTPSNQFPLVFKAPGLNDFVFPIDPLISINKKNIITRRTVSKGKTRGTVKERWTQDDIEITISGVFISSDGNYPGEVSALNVYADKHEAIDVECSFLNEMNVFKIVIETLSLPHTKGIENQAFEIKALSDDVVQLLIEN